MKALVVDGHLVSPSKIVCIGRNYVEHIKELNNEMPDQAVIFVKPNSAICSEVFSGQNDAVHYEAELSFVIESGNIAAVGFGLDLTKRALQAKLKTKGLPWERAKAFDKSAVFSEFVRLNGQLEELSLHLYINGQLLQEADFGLMIFKPQQLIEEVASFMTFEDGDILMTGTPKGVGEVFQGDQFIGRIFAAGSLLIEQQWTVK